jgi:CubicO group peptidase (beta-lactamase class C family)
MITRPIRLGSLGRLRGVDAMHITRRALITAVVLLTGEMAAGEDPSASFQYAAQIDAMFAKYDQPNAPGCVVGIIQNGELVYSKGFGSANLDYDVGITPQTSFDVASVTKSFTSVCVALLMDQGKLREDDDIRKFLPEMHAFDPPITVGDLLRCHSGLRDYIFLMPMAGWPLEIGWVQYTEADVLQILAAQRTLHFPSGTKLAYSNSDYFLLGQIVARVSGKSLPQFAKENIFDPLGMSCSEYLDHPARMHRQRAVGYERELDGWNGWIYAGPVMGGCGVRTCIDDLYRWDQNFDHNLLPQGEHLDQFLRDGELAGNRYCLDTDANQKKMKPDPAAEPAGQYRGLKRLQFTGGGWGSMAGIARFPDQHFTVICLANTEDIIPWNVAADIAELCLAADLGPKKKTESPRDATNLAELDASDAPSESELRAHVGQYLDDDWRLWTIDFNDGALQLTHDRFAGAFRLRPIKEGRFIPVDFPFQNETLRFERRDGEDRDSLIYEWPVGSCEFKPIEPLAPTDEQLASYAGRYDSDELLASYRFRVAEGALQLRVNNLAWETLTPTLADHFVPRVHHAMDMRVFRFHRSEGGDVSSLELDCGRARGVQLQRVAE